ncbi:class F sortase [Nocardioides ultimimeridianus]
MSSRVTRQGGGVAGWAGVALLAFVLAGVVLLRPGHAVVAASPRPGPVTQRVAAAAPAPSRSVRPVRLDIPRIDVATPLIRLGLTADRELEVPPLSHAGVAGWYDLGPVPGDAGPAVLAGHVDSEDGPAVFYGLSALRPGDRLTVDRSDHRTAVFSVDRVTAFAKSRFPTRAVYGETHDAELRLITCGGTYDPTQGGYQSNVVVFAHLDRLMKTPREDR